MGLQSRGRLSHWVSKSKTGTFVRLAKGIETLDDAKNPQTQEFTWIDDSADTTTNGFKESWAVSGYLYEGDDASEMLHEMAWSNAKNEAAELCHVVVRHWMPINGQTNAFDAKLNLVSFASDNEGGGTGGESVTFSGSLNAKGEPQFGAFNIATGIFTPR